jgi:hypothetical protein
MPVPVAVGDIVQVTPRYTLEGQQCENVLHFRCVAADSDMTLHLLKVIAQCFITHLVPVLGNQFKLESVHGKIVGPAVGEEDEWVPLATDTITGAVATDTLPSFVSAVVGIYSTQPGRSGRGHFSLGGIVAADTVGSLLNLTAPTWIAIGAFVACVLASFPNHELSPGDAYEWGIYSRKLGGVTKPPYPVAGFHPVRRVVPRQELGTVRRRKLGRGK